ncbi:MAG TPA: hypothetical protein VIV40_43795 [Kofleriaceae bacterium]
MRRLWLLVVLAGCGRFGFGSSDKPDSAIGDAPRDGPADAPTLTCLPSYSVCDGFEGPSIDSSTWMVDPMIAIDTTRAHRGASSLHVHAQAFAAGQGSYTSLFETKTLVSGATTFWVRGWFWLSALPAPGNGMELITAERPGSAGDYVFVFSNRTSVYSQFDLSSQEAMVAVPAASWFCVVFKIVRSTTASGALEASGDIPPLALTGVITDAAQPMTQVTLGMGFASSNVLTAQPALDLWIDDVIVHTSPLTCSD